MVSTILIILLALVIAALLALALAAPLLFPLRGERATRLTATCSDGWQLAVWHRKAGTRRFREPVVLCHGLGNNHRVFDLDAPLSLVLALNEAGFDTYAVDLRGAGQSQRAPKSAPFHASVDDHVQLDVPAVLELARTEAGSDKVLWVGHSLGGVIGLASADERHLAGIVTIGSPVYFSSLQARTKIALKLGRYIAWPRRIRLDMLARLSLPFAGFAPAYLSEGMVNARNMDGAVQRVSLAQMIAPIWRGVLLQLADWVSHDALRSLDGKVDYRERIAAMQVPLLTVGGAVDRLAPLDVVQRAHALAGSPDKTLLIEMPEGVSYGHGDLLLGRAAPQHVYARIAAWLAAHATAVSSS